MDESNRKGLLGELSAEEELKVISILNDLGLSENDDIILIDARNDNKSSASNVKIEKSI